MSAFDPNSNDAMFARVLAKLDEHAEILLEIKDQGRKSEHRISMLESWREELKGRVAVLSILISAGATLMMHILIKMFMP